MRKVTNMLLLWFPEQQASCCSHHRIPFGSPGRLWSLAPTLGAALATLNRNKCGPAHLRPFSLSLLPHTLTPANPDPEGAGGGGRGGVDPREAAGIRWTWMGNWRQQDLSAYKARCSLPVKKTKDDNNAEPMDSDQPNPLHAKPASGNLDTWFKSRSLLRNALRCMVSSARLLEQWGGFLGGRVPSHCMVTISQTPHDTNSWRITSSSFILQGCKKKKKPEQVKQPHWYWLSSRKSSCERNLRADTLRTD